MIAKKNTSFGVTDIQKAYLIGRNKNFELGGVGTHLYSEIESFLDISKLNKALNKVIVRHPILRTVFNLETQQQVVLDEIPIYKIDYVDISLLSMNRQKSLIEQERLRLSHQVFDPKVWPLFELKAFKLANDKNYLFFSYDMLIGDGFSIRLLESELLEYYYNIEKELPELNYTFQNYISDYEKLLETRRYERAKEYHLKRLDILPLGPTLPLKKSIPEVAKPHFKRLQYFLPRDKWIKFKRISKELNVTPTIVLCAMYVEVLNLWTQEDKYILNITVFNRYPFNKEVSKIMGDFTSVILMDIDKQLNGTTQEKLRFYQHKIIELLSYRHYDGVRLLRELAKHRNLGTKALTPIVFTSMLYDKGIEDIAEEERLGKFVYGLSQTPQVILDNQVSDINNELAIIWDYVDDVFDENIIGAMFEQYKNIIRNFIETKELEKVIIPDYDLKFIEEYNKTNNCLGEYTLDQLFYNQINKLPDKVCVVCDEKQYTYRELDIRSNKIANFLIKQGLQPSEYVGVLVQRHSDTIANLLGILKAGGAYVPLEPNLPADRFDYILKQCNSKICLDIDSYDKYGIEEFEDSQVHGYSNVNNMAYVIFTSGSTGNPKGVMVTHKSATNTITDINIKFRITQNDKIIGLSSMGFDLSVYDIFGTLSVGATLYIAPDIRDVDNISDMISEHQITFWNSVPSAMNLLIEGLINSDKRFVKYESLKNVLLSGDWIPLSLPGKIKKYFPNSNVISLGGATEGSIWSIYYPIDKIDSSWKSIPYGYPLSNQKMYVLNNDFNLCPLEVEGEIFIGGKGVATGYIGEKSKMEYSFINHPRFGYIYRTGDYGIMHREGYIEFKGRKDSQVKIGGHRIELGEIEYHLDSYCGIKNSVATVFEYTPGDKRIVAYYVEDSSNADSISSDELKDYLKGKLPQYMIPFTLINIRELPLTKNQKVDRSKLPAPNFDGKKYGKESLQSLSLVEKKLLSQWKKIIGLNNISINDNFFDLGGDSLQAYQAIVSAEEEFELKISIAYLYKNPTISGIANYIDENINVKVTEKDIPKDSKTKIYWNPSYQWKISDGKLLIGGSLYSDVELFPQFYFLTQDGITIDDLYRELPSGKIDSLNSFLELSLKKGYVLKNLPDYSDLFKATERFVSKPFDEELILNPVKYNNFKRNIMGRDLRDTGQIVKLNDSGIPRLAKRRTWRNFEESKTIGFSIFSKLMSTFKQRNHNGKYLYYYASAGGLYPIDTYLYIKANRVENINQGLYYYHPSSHSLKLVNSTTIDSSSSYHKNKEIFNGSAVSIYFLFNPNVSMPIYGGNGYYYAIIDTGIMVATLTQVCEDHNIGLCSIGDMDFKRIDSLFNISNQKFLHSVEIGIKGEKLMSFEEIVSNYKK